MGYGGGGGEGYKIPQKGVTLFVDDTLGLNANLLTLLAADTTAPRFGRVSLVTAHSATSPS